MARTKKARNWATIIYPESEKPGWRNTLSGWHIQAFAVLHDSDVDPETGEAKKDHIHLMAMWPSAITEELARERMKELGGVGLEVCQSQIGYARYLCHLDNPEKHQYSPQAVESFGGANYVAMIEKKPKSKKLTKGQIISEMMDWCSENCVTCFKELCDYARKEKPDTWFELLISYNGCAVTMCRYMEALERRPARWVKGRDSPSVQICRQTVE